MKLILHIGTHKTASTSMQHFCAINRRLLRQHGFHYPKNNDSAYVANYLASRLAHNKEEEVDEFFTLALKDAKKLRCHTVIVSAESFYAMTGFFLLMNNKPIPNSNYWKHEEQAIKKLKQICEMYDDTIILCYLRPQDDYASSIYNQMIKAVYGITDEYMPFLERTRPIYDYYNHFKLWQKFFGRDSLVFRKFQDVRENPVFDFSRQTVGKNIYYSAKKKKIHTNERLSRDILEYKRIKNKKRPDKSLAFVNVRCFRQLSKEYPDKPGYQVFSPSSERCKFFAQFEAGNKLLSADCELKSFLNVESEPTYPGLSNDKLQAIEQRYFQLLNTPRNKMERGLRQTTNKIINHVPVMDRLLTPARIARNWIRLRLEGW